MVKSLILTGKTVVVHEPCGLTAMQVGHFLVRSGCALVLKSADTRETAEAIRRLKPDLVLMDIEPVAADGFAAITEAAAASAACLVVITTEMCSVAQTRARSVGADGCLCKPFTADMLAVALEQALSCSLK